jgi:hypothetical protein
LHRETIKTAKDYEKENEIGYFGEEHIFPYKQVEGGNERG